MRVAMMCARANAVARLRTFDSIADARAAAMARCGDPLCRLDHLVGWQEHGCVAVEFVGRRPPPTLAAALAELYHHVPETGLPIACWPAPPELNPKQGARR